MSSRRGFTLLEMLLATVLSVMLMVGVLAAVASIGTGSAAGKGHDSPVKSAEGLAGWQRLLQEDLNLATRIDASRVNQVTLIGYLALDDSTRERTHRPAKVLYRFEEIAGRKWVVRRQALLDIATNQNVQRDLVCSGVNRFKLTAGRDLPASAPDSPDASDALDTSGEAAKAAPRTAPVESAGPGPKMTLWRLRVWTTDPASPVRDCTVTLRPALTP